MSIEKRFSWMGDRGVYSVFQPIYSFSNQSCIGFEALIRGENRQGEAISVVDCLQAPAEMPRPEYTRNINRLHMSNWKAMLPSESWLFLNLDFQGVSSLDEVCVEELLAELNMDGRNLVIEVVESEIPDEAVFFEVINTFRNMGCLIALDDFGAGHSNVDRIWKAQPDIVKLDRHILLEATKSLRSASVLRNLTRLIKQAGSICLLEGIETREQALLAMDVGVDLVQGFYFARPQFDGLNVNHGLSLMHEVTHDYPAYFAEKVFLKRIQKKGYETLYEGLSKDLNVQELTQKIEALTQLTFVKRGFILDEQGYQVSDDTAVESAKNGAGLKKGKGFCWRNRRYFIKAMENQHEIYVSEPYRSLIDIELCLTVSKVFFTALGERFVVCFDVFYHDKSTETVQISV